MNELEQHEHDPFLAQQERHQEGLQDDGPASEPQNGSVAETDSVLGRIRATRESKAAEMAPMKDLIVPEYNEALIVRYRYPESGYQTALKVARRELQSNDPDARLQAAEDILIACCVSVLGRTPDGKAIDLLTDRILPDNEAPDLPLRFGDRLAESLKIVVPAEVKSKPRYIVRSLFSPRGPSRGEWEGDLALIRQSNELFLWLNKAEDELDTELSGE